ncbi:MAG: DMT family transporter [Clostridia bacterium]|nr:DMT family transporter [Clostridia bacterium]
MAIVSHKNKIIGVALLSLCALIWGFAFVAQSNVTDTLSAFAFCGLRFSFSFAGLAVVAVVYRICNKRFHYQTIPWNLQTIIGGIMCGIALYFAMLCQQIGIEFTSVGKTSFITAMYIVFVPIIGIAARQKPTVFSIPAILIAVLGFYFMCITGKFSVTIGDLLVLMCAGMYSMQILLIGLYVKVCDPIRLTLVQFASAAVVGIIGMAITGMPTGLAIKNSIWEILYLGLLSGTIGFTMQTAGQKSVPSSVATLIMSMEAVVGLVGGVIFLHQIPTAREVLGCMLVLVAVILAQFETHKTFLEFKSRKYFLN